MLKQLNLEFVFRETARSIRIEVIYSERRTLGLEVSREGQVKLRAPRRTADRVIQNFAESRKAWIIEKYLLAEARREAAAERGVPDYVEHPELEKRYREMARKKLEERTAYYARRMGVSYNRISIRAARTRWGSCSGAGNLNFHWKLIRMPEAVLDYVVVHELAHRKEMNHSAAFWAIVEGVLPDYRERRRWLKQYGQTV
ncbi:MAG: M48 family metallopeptidase [Lachnospiraceae bacterium]|nr:M48 family metallopeptidase [Lachnospiraceae bacterium]